MQHGERSAVDLGSHIIDAECNSQVKTLADTSTIKSHVPVESSGAAPEKVDATKMCE